MKKALIIYNPVSGWLPSKSILYDLIQNLSVDGFISVVYMTQKDVLIEEKILDLTKGIDKIICCGGDGTLHAVLNALIKHNIRIPLGYIPIGTTNDFASAHSIPHNLNEAYKLIQKENIQELDVGKFGEDNYFTYIACFGIFTKLTYGASQPLKNLLGQFAYLIEGTKELGDLSKPYPLTIEVNDSKIEGEFIFGAVVNSLSFAGFFTLPVTQEELSDGLLEVVLVKHPSNFVELSDVAGSMFTSTYESENTLLLKTKKIKFISKEPIAWNLDGEFAGNLKEVTIEVKEQALEIIVG